MKHLYILIFVLFSMFFSPAVIGAAVVAGGGDLYESVIIGDPIKNPEINERLQAYKNYLEKVKSELPEKDPNVAVAFVYLTTNSGAFYYLNIPMTFISGWSLEKKRGAGVKAKWTSEYLGEKFVESTVDDPDKANLDEFVGENRFVSDFYEGGDEAAKLAEYKILFNEFIEAPRRGGVLSLGDDWGGFKEEFRKAHEGIGANMGNFSRKFCHTEYAVLNALSAFVENNFDEINKEEPDPANPGNVRKKYIAYGVAMLSYQPSCITCQRLIRREFETMYFFKKNLTIAEKAQLGGDYSIKVNSVVSPG